MIGYVVDASIAVKWFVTESQSDRAARLLESGAPLHAPDLLHVEVANALWAMARRNEITLEDAREVLGLLISAPVDTSVPTCRLAPMAIQLAADIDHPVYDCIYLALAIEVGKPVVSVDRRFLSAVRAHSYLSGFAVHLPDLA